MRGEISLNSNLGQGTKATFTIPFNKPTFQGPNGPLVEVGAVPERLFSDLSLSCNSSQRDRATSTPPIAPTNGLPTDVSNNFPASTGSPNPITSQSTPSILGPEQRHGIHILVVEDNAINQQIALKTIRNLNFSVSAVWNGKEALDYLLQSPSPARPTPHLILMDVQMPILDGYRATHMLRHHSPFRQIERIQAIPIVAMTASAIQGDREKCQRAGMDDYLAKPVKRTTLEKMILKWVSDEVVNRRLTQSHDRQNQGLKNRTNSAHGLAVNTNAPTHHDSFHSSDCPNSPSLENPTSPQPQPLPNILTSSNPSYLATATTVTSESEAQRGIRRAELEEKALSLRDDKLLAASGPGTPTATNNSTLRRNQSEQGSGGQKVLALTEENVRAFEGGKNPSLEEASMEDGEETRGAENEEEVPSEALVISEDAKYSRGSAMESAVNAGGRKRGELPRMNSDWSGRTVLPTRREKKGHSGD
ncbi:MAG: hypothetical protein Q9227_004269 [Pyrenula ochraceoflavens]